MSDYLDGFSFVLICIVVLLVVAFGIVKPIGEISCNQRAEELQVDGDYRFMSSTCYLTLKNGQVIPANQFRSVERNQR